MDSFALDCGGEEREKLEPCFRKIFGETQCHKLHKSEVGQVWDL